MDLLIRVSLFLWIAFGQITWAEKCKQENVDQDTLKVFKHVFQNVCYEFIETPKNWSQAELACSQRGGQLLKVMDCEVKTFLQNFTQDTKLNWWVGEGILGTYQGNQVVPTDNGSSPFLCTYLTLDPLQLVTTRNCSIKQGYLCTLYFRFLVNTSNSQNTNNLGDGKKKRFARTLPVTPLLENDTSKYLQYADSELQRMELTVEEPTENSKMEYINFLLKITQILTRQGVIFDNSTISHIISSTGAILLLSMKKCGGQGGQNDQALYDKSIEIYLILASVMGTPSTKPIVVQHETGTIYVTSTTPAALDNMVLGSDDEGVSITFPSYSVLKPHVGNLAVVKTQLATYSENPHASNETITGAVCNLVLFNDTSEIHITNLSEAFEIHFARSNATAVTTKTMNVMNGTAVLTSFNVSDTNQTVVINMEPTRNVSLQLLLGAGAPPNHTRYNHSTILKPTGGYRWLVTPEMLEDRAGLWYIQTSLYNTTWSPGLQLRITTFSSKCMYWDPDLNSWSIYGCWVGINSSPENTHCLCNHLTFFGSSFFVKPNYIDLTRTAEYFSTVKDNYVVLALLSAFFGLYLLTLIWAWYSDRKAMSRRKMTLLADSHPCACYNYLLSVQTGHRKGAGTSAKVTVKLTGAEGDSDTHQLTDSSKPAVLERGAVDVFLLATPYPLGELQSLRLWHNNEGENPSWYVDKVTVQDLQTRKVCHFLCSSWLSAEKGEGLTKKTFTPAKNNEIASFRNIFQNRTAFGFRDEHIWVSVVDPPWRSPFTRAQRVSCCMSLLLCTMAINIAFWNIPKDGNSPIILKIGSLEITWEQIMVGVESGLLMFPINILIITIFRSIRPRLSKTSGKDTRRQTIKPHVVTMPTILKDTEDLVNMLSRNQRNQVVELKERLLSSSDLVPALESVHGVIHLMQGESESHPHWVFCSQFVLSCLRHLSMSLERLNPGIFSNPEEHQQLLSTSTLILKKAEMVCTSHMTYCPPPVCKPKKAACCTLPWWFVFIAWFLLLSISGISTYFTLIYGFEYGRDRSIQWVISLGLSLFQSIFIMQPLKVIGLAVFFALLLKPRVVEENEEIELLLAEQKERCQEYSGRQLQ
ncbi:polycystic kidney disease protein 1-like 2 isoform X2 [Hypomesus transpacificus]|uniref:polycystic kidney disease protein 1-like 2 isoform X2 n=1 Tax=Hypomesus transpacificus TaxID=137520 RepID=UPI001F078E17|nr:polycystic kidney disease protein 1-like 2 isoform X2 [Hypomesus transpacificus]